MSEILASFRFYGCRNSTSKGFRKLYSAQKKPATNAPVWKELVAGYGTLSKALAHFCALTFHRSTVPPSGERAVVVAIAVALPNHLA
jgi:hypothetical protein